MINIGENIKTSRKALGLTQEELAVQIGVTPQAVSRWESGSGLPDVTLIVSLADALSVTTDMLLGVDRRDTDESELASIKEALDKLDKENKTPWDAAGAKVKYMLELVESKPMNHVAAAVFTECVADLSRYMEFAGKNDEKWWRDLRLKAIGSGTQVIRFSGKPEWITKTHYALAWIYAHDNDYASAREHINKLPSIKGNRLKESMLQQITAMEFGLDDMKKVLTNNLRELTLAYNKELVYAYEEICWLDDPNEAISYGNWLLDLMASFQKREDLIPYCRGFLWSVYKYMVIAHLRNGDSDAAVKTWNRFDAELKRHRDYYARVLADESLRAAYEERTINSIMKHDDKKIESIKTATLSYIEEPAYNKSITAPKSVLASVNSKIDPKVYADFKSKI